VFAGDIMHPGVFNGIHANEVISMIFTGRTDKHFLPVTSNRLDSDVADPIVRVIRHRSTPKTLLQAMGQGLIEEHAILRFVDRHDRALVVLLKSALFGSPRQDV
jgi:hypothetical protein